MKLGIFGGSFDPVHLGHLLVAQAAVEELGLDRLFFIPAAQSPFKPENKPAPDAVRLQLLRLALAGKTNCEIDEQEIRRGGISYTVDTLRDYAKRFSGAKLFYLIGADKRRSSTNGASRRNWLGSRSLWRFRVPAVRRQFFPCRFEGGCCAVSRSACLLRKSARG